MTIRVGIISRRRPNDIDAIKNSIAEWIDLIILVGPLSLDVYNYDEGENLPYRNDQSDNYFFVRKLVIINN